MTAPPAGFFQKPLYKRRKMRYNGKAFAQRGIAQLVEQRSPKPRAEGSNPSAPAKKIDSSSNRTGCLRYQRTLSGFEPRRPVPWKTQQKSRPVILDKAAPECYINVSKNGCQCKWRSSLIGVYSSKETPLTALVGGYFLCLKAVTTRDARPMSTSVYVNISAYVTTSRTPFSIAGVSAETPLRHRSAGRARSDGRNHVPPVNPLLFGRKTRDGRRKSHEASFVNFSALRCMFGAAGNSLPRI